MRFIQLFLISLTFVIFCTKPPKGLPETAFPEGGIAADFMPPDMPADNWIPVGKGKIDFKSIFRKGNAIGVKWYILEMDKYDGNVYAAFVLSIYSKRETPALSEGPILNTNARLTPGQRRNEYFLFSRG